MTPAPHWWLATPRAVSHAGEAGHHSSMLPSAAAQASRRLADRTGAAAGKVFLAAFAVLLAGHGAGPDLVIGEFAIDVDAEATFPEVIRAVRPKDAGRAGPFFQFVWAGGLPAGRCALALAVTPDGDRFRIEFRHGTGMISNEDVAALADRYAELLISLDARPWWPVLGIPQLAAADREIIAAANDTASAPAPGLLRSIAGWVAARPDATAVATGSRVVTYRQLWSAAAETAGRLNGRGANPGDVVAVCAPRGPELAAAVLGVWLAGAAYLPLDPDHPARRIEQVLDDSDARILLCPANRPLPGTGPATLALPEVGPISSASGHPAFPDEGDAPAYLIYTSGSTGKPKGTKITHAALANQIAYFADELGVTPRDATLWLSTFTFDTSTLELMLPLATGGRLVVAPDECRLNGVALAEVVLRHDVGVLQATPTTWRLVVADVGTALNRRRVLSGGEPLPVPLARALLDAGCELRNIYGPTETTIWSTCGRVTADRLPETTGRIDVGRPIRNVRVVITAPSGRELPVGVTGELRILGRGVAAGYHNRPELTAERFGRQASYGRHFATGDVARWRPDGTIELVGRRDRQVKLRGNRIELGEVEAVLATSPLVAACAVVAVGDLSDAGALVAFVEAPAGAATAELAGHLWEHARRWLPDAVVPHRFEVLAALPRTVNDKIDYVRLAARATWSAPAAEARLRTIEDPLIEALIGIFRELLTKTVVGPETNFFLAGGNSLKAAQLSQRIRQATGVRPRLADIFANTTPTALAGLVRKLTESPMGATAECGERG